MARGKNQTEQSHPIWHEIRAIAALLLAIFVGGSLLSFHPSDPLIWNVSGPLGPVQNLFGTVGAHVSGALFLVMGFSSLWLVVICLGWSIISFRGEEFDSLWGTSIALICLILASAGLLNLKFAKPVLFRGSHMIAGGLVGLYLSHFSKQLLNNFGSYLLLGAVFLISLMYLTHLSIRWILSTIWSWVMWLFRAIALVVDKRKAKKQRAKKSKKAQRKISSKPKVRVISPPPEPKKEPEQVAFPFMATGGKFSLPSLDLLNDPPEKRDVEIHQDSLEMNARLLEKKLADFGVEGEVLEILPGPVITMYEFKPAPGIKISKVAGLSDDLALALRAPSIRIVAPIPGKAAIGIEIPNNKRETVYLKEILSSPDFKNTRYRLPIALGKDITGAPVITDLTKMPHLLVAGATGSGKSVSINTMINSLLFKVSPENVRFLMIDPKRIELSVYHDIPHLMYPVVTNPKEATKILRWAVDEMERRYMLLSDRGFRNIETYNRGILKAKKPPTEEETAQENKPLPYIILVIDELADLMMASSREVEEAITRLAQMARAAGIHLIIATQRPSVDVITGIIKANFPARISFQVTSKVDSRTILDTIGAENLLGEGDMLFLPPGVARIMRIHGAFVSEEEITRVTDFLRAQRKPDYETTILSKVQEEEEAEELGLEKDERYDEAVEIVLKTGQASISMLQRKLRVGYNRAARMIEIMEREGIVGPSDGVRPREVYGRKEI